MIGLGGETGRNDVAGLRAVVIGLPVSLVMWAGLLDAIRAAF
ncbi:hypothetical protein [Sphingomonas profundi]|nr:hypothetical protein [Sphingomonas profundi]